MLKNAYLLRKSGSKMRLSDAAKLLWDNKVDFNFGSRPEWDPDTFKREWVNKTLPKSWKNVEGIYWISTNATLDDLCALQRPADLPESGCDMGVLTSAHRVLFKGNLCTDFGLTVIYNGQRSQVFSRLRSHFNISSGTGALGIGLYRLSSFRWTASVFHIGMLDRVQRLSGRTRQYIHDLLRSEAGRCAIEAAWRTEHGWPVLCKK